MHIFFSLKKNIIFCKNFVVKSYFASIISEKGRIREAQKHADPTDPDPQHYFLRVHDKLIQAY